MTTKNIIEGLAILEKYRIEENGYNTEAEYEKLCARPTDMTLSDEDLARMIELGWFQEVDGGDWYEDEFPASNYDPNERWVCFV